MVDFKGDGSRVQPLYGTQGPQKRFRVQTHWCASKKPYQSFATKLDLGVPTSCQGWVCCCV